MLIIIVGMGYYIYYEKTASDKKINSLNKEIKRLKQTNENVTNSQENETIGKSNCKQEIIGQIYKNDEISTTGEISDQIQFSSDQEFTKVDGTTAWNGEYKVEDNVITLIDGVGGPGYDTYLIISQDCSTIYHIYDNESAVNILQKQ